MFYRSHDRVFAPVSGKSRTRQEFADECDINNIMRQYQRVGVISHTSGREPRFIDNWDAPDFMGAMNLMIEANDAFMRLPSRVRKEFDNDPSQFVRFAEDKDNLPKLREWGLAAPEKAPEAPMRVEVVNPAPPPEGGSTAS